MSVKQIYRENIHRDEIKEIFIYPDEVIIKLKKEPIERHHITIKPDVRLCKSEGGGYNLNATLEIIKVKD